MILLDTSVLIDSLCGERRSEAALRAAIGDGHRLLLAAPVLYEWLRGPRRDEQLADQEALLPAEAALPFGPREAVIAARLYQTVPHPRGRETDLAIAACAIAQNAELWTLNRPDFEDVPGLRLY